MASAEETQKKPPTTTTVSHTFPHSRRPGCQLRVNWWCSALQGVVKHDRHTAVRTAGEPLHNLGACHVQAPGLTHSGSAPRLKRLPQQHTKGVPAPAVKKHRGRGCASSLNTFWQLEQVLVKNKATRTHQMPEMSRRVGSGTPGASMGRGHSPLCRVKGREDK